MAEWNKHSWHGPHFVMWFSEDGLQIVEKRNKGKVKGKDIPS